MYDILIQKRLSARQPSSYVFGPHGSGKTVSAKDEIKCILKTSEDNIVILQTAPGEYDEFLDDLDFPEYADVKGQVWSYYPKRVSLITLSIRNNGEIRDFGGINISQLLYSIWMIAVNGGKRAWLYIDDLFSVLLNEDYLKAIDRTNIPILNADAVKAFSTITRYARSRNVIVTAVTVSKEPFTDYKELIHNMGGWI